MTPMTSGKQKMRKLYSDGHEIITIFQNRKFNFRSVQQQIADNSWEL